MAAPTLNKFVTELRTRNIARPNQYYVEITAPPIFTESIKGFSVPTTGLVSTWCSSAMTPQSMISTRDDFVEAGVRRKYIFDQDYQNLILNFYIDQSYDIKLFFDQWKNSIVAQRRNFNYPDKYTAESLNVYIIDQENNETYKYEYSRVVPKTINSIDLSYANGATVSSFTVEFVFEEVYFTSIKSGSVNFTSKPEDIAAPTPPPANKEVAATSFEDSSMAGRSANGTIWTQDMNGITGVKPFQMSDILPDWLTS